VACPLIDIPYPEQLIRKRQILSEALEHYPLLASIDVPPVVSSPRRLGYRARVKLPLRNNNGGVVAGLYKPGSHRVVDVSSCAVHPHWVNRVVQYTTAQVVKLEISPYDEQADKGHLRYLDIHYSFWKRRLLLTLVTRHAELPQGRELARRLRKRFPFISGIVHNINEDRGNVIWGKEFRPLSGQGTILEKVGSLKLKYPAGAFAQTNPAVARKLYEAVVTLADLSGHETVIDLYCGVGPISLSLASSCRLVWGVDESVPAIAAAKQNARLNGFGNCRFFTGDVSEKVEAAKSALPRADLVVLNPPRKGIQPAQLASISSLGAPKVIYVSCEPRTLARDLDRLSAKGYRVQSVLPFDMFPQTEEVETLVLLRKSQD
jgi:23S rRNA (uracil-5-)-methyltransferase RumA